MNEKKITMIWLGGTIAVALCAFGISYMFSELIGRAGVEMADMAYSAAGLSGLAYYVGIALWILREH